MADEGSKVTNPFDVQTIRALVALMSRHDLSEIDLREGLVRIRLRRGAQGTPIVAPTPAATGDMAIARPVEITAVPQPIEPAKPPKNLVTIKSPTPGTFYSRPKPEDPPFVQVGARVTPTTVVCIIEAMKIFNEINADTSGVITQVLVENQQAVEYGQPLFTVDPTG